LTCEDKSAEIAAHVIEWLTEPAKLSQRVAALERLREEVAQPGASRRAAEIILKEGGRMKAEELQIANCRLQIAN
jgi:hypothetical protein